MILKAKTCQNIPVEHIDLWFSTCSNIQLYSLNFSMVTKNRQDYTHLHEYASKTEGFKTYSH